MQPIITCHGVFSIFLLSGPKRSVYINESAEPLPFVSGGPENCPLYTNRQQSAHVYAKTAVLFLCINENFSGFHLQELAQRLFSKNCLPSKETLFPLYATKVRKRFVGYLSFLSFSTFSFHFRHKITPPLRQNTA